MPDFSQAFNVVLNAPGVSAFVAGLNKAGSAVSAVTHEIDKIKTASNLSGHALELQQAQYDKLSARVDATSARLAAYRLRVEESNQTVERGTQTLVKSQSEQARLSADIAKYTTVLRQLEAQGEKNTSGYQMTNKHLAEMKQEYKEVTARVAEQSTELDKARIKNEILNKTLKVREASLALIGKQVEVKGEPLQLTKAETTIANLLKMYNSVRKLSYSLQEAQGTFGRFRAFGEFLGLLPPKVNKVADSAHILDQRFKDVNQTSTMLTRPGLGLMAVASALGNIVATTVVNGLSMVANSILGLKDAAFQASAEQERLIYSIRAMLAQQKVMKDDTLDMNDAMKQSTKEASRYIRWMEQFSILSPFTATDIKLIFQNAMGMGMAADQAARLTEATTNWAAATGKAGYAMQLAQYAISQMNASAKLNMQDVRQLANQGIGLSIITKQLAKDLGKTTEEIQRMQAAGKITGAEGAAAVLHYMETFGEAAKAQAGTLQGLRSSLEELAPMFLRNFFGPIDEATGKVGGVLGVVQEKLQKLVDFLQTDFALGTARSMGETFGNLARDAVSWGENLVASFAQGIYNGALHVVKALTDVANVITSWLMPGSPPRILPNIDRWGALTLAEYMQGWKITDFSTFNDLAGTLEGMIRSISVDLVEGWNPLDRTIRAREQIAAAVGQIQTLGDVTQDTMNHLLATVAGAPEFVADYVRTFFAVAKQQKIVNDLAKKYDDQLKEIDEKLKQIDDRQSEYLEDNRASQLELIANDPNATLQEKAMARFELEKIAAQKRRRQIEAEKEAALKPEIAKLDALQEQLAIQRELINVQQRQNGLIQEYANELKNAANAAKGGAGVKPVVKPGAGFPGKVFDEEAKPITDPKTYYEQMGAAQTAPINELMLRFGLLIRKIQEIFDTVKQKWQEAQPYITQIKTDLGTAWEAVKSGFIAAWERINELLGDANTKLPTTAEVINGLGLAIRFVGAFIGALSFLIGIFIAIIIRLIEKGVELKRNVEVWALIFQTLKNKWDESWIIIQSRLSSFLGEVRQKIYSLKIHLAEKWEEIKTATIQKWNEIKDFFIKEPDGVIPKIIKIFTETDWMKLGQDIISGIVEGLFGQAFELYNAIRGIIDGALRAGQNAAESKSPSRKAARVLGAPLSEGVAEGVLSKAALVNAAMRSVVGMAISPPMSGRQQAANYHYETSTVNNWNYNPVYNSPAPSPIRDFAIMQVWAGG